MVPARNPSCSCHGNWEASEQKWNEVPALGTFRCPTSPLCHPGAERVTHLSLLTPVSSVALPSLLYFFVNCQPVPGLAAEGAPWDGSGDLTDPQQASAWTFCRDEGFPEGQGQSPILLGLGETEINPCLQTASHQQKKVTKSQFFQPKDPSPLLSFAPPLC